LTVLPHAGVVYTDLLVVAELLRQAFAKITELKQQGRAR
jgi:hypothetical protein